MIGTILSFVTIMLLFDISWTFFGHILIILTGIAILFKVTYDKNQ
jgi:hypothetical protein